MAVKRFKLRGAGWKCADLGLGSCLDWTVGASPEGCISQVCVETE